MSEHSEPSDSPKDDKPIRPNLIGIVTGVLSLMLFGVSHFTLGFPDMFIHVLMLPVIIGLVTRWSVNLNYTNTYRDE
ncbi:MAG: hypothetical protein VX569_10510 [Pseudomonadota bacterium]|nr:hypothetical protein [Pseudomonadota bacterium]